MAPQSYELSFVGSILVIFFCIVLAILAVNLFISICRYVIGHVLGISKSGQTSRQLIESSTQTSWEEDASSKDKSGLDMKQPVGDTSLAGGDGKKTD